MLIGTYSVLFSYGLYYVFARISEKHLIVAEEYENPLTEEIDHNEPHRHII
jgi:HAE1 family hydrophobic/amphiphilic exporter-1